MMYDITTPIRTNMPVWPGQPPVSIKPLSLLEKQGSRVSWLSFASHIGTHIDAPAHFVQNGQTVDQLPLNQLIGPARVLDLTHVAAEISRADLEGQTIKQAERILFKTRNNNFLKESAFRNDYIHLSLEGAKYVVECGVSLVGIDYLGIEKRGSPGHPVHTQLLSHGVIILEGLTLSDIPAGEYTLYCLPLKIEGGDGAPARAILVRN